MTGGLSVRSRLTLLYGGLVLATGIGLIVLVNFLMRYVPRYQFVAPARRVPTDPSETMRVRPIPATVIQSKDDVLDTLLLMSVLGLIGLTLLAFGVGWIVAGRVLNPIQRITSTAHRVASRNLHERINLEGPRDEFTELADTFDGMLARLDTSFQAQQRFAANASHELRTPLTTTRTMLQVALARPEEQDVRVLGPKLLATNERSIRTVEALLTLTRAEQRIDDPRPVDVAVLATEALDEVAEEAQERGVTVHETVHPAVVDGDAELLRQLIVNLLRNAVRHNHPDGHAALLVSGGDRATITVTNTGEKHTAVERFFEPFYRDRTRTRSSGHGLGLSLVRAIAEAHHGTAAAVPNPDGGLTATVTLPASRNV